MSLFRYTAQIMFVKVDFENSRRAVEVYQNNKLEVKKHKNESVFTTKFNRVTLSSKV